MTFRRSVLATLTVCALALAGCNQDSNAADPKGEKADDKAVGSIAARLTLPDDSEIDSVHYTISGPGTPAYHLEGDVPVGDSTVLTFRIGGIPVASGYTISLDADTSFGNTCMGSSPFDILDNGVSSVTVTLVCGAADNVGDLIVNGNVTSCPVITAISAIPAEITLGHSMSLEAQISHGSSPLHWTGTGGTFATPDAHATTFSCVDAGTHTLTVAVNTPDCHDAKTVDVTCTLGAGCGNGNLDSGEQCDDGNTVDTDGCTNSCHLPVCGDNIVSTGEQCDGGNNLPNDGCSATCQNEVCGDGIKQTSEGCDDGNTVSGDGCSSTCHLEGCGDGVVQPSETCDDSNNVTESCAYGTAAGTCQVCDSTCHFINAPIPYCGDSIVNGAEQCDAGPSGSASCTPTCTSINACVSCENANCTNYQGYFDTVHGCFDTGAAGVAARMTFGSTAAGFSPTYVQTCVDAIACAHSHHCGNQDADLASTTIADQCYCGAFGGTWNLDACSAANQATVATHSPACQTEWEALTQQTIPANVLLAISDAENTMAGYAYSLLECEANFCDACQ